MPTVALPVFQCCAPLAAGPLSDAEAAQLERVFKALADRHRIKILNLLLGAGDEAVCVCDLQDLLGLKQSTTSYHLKQLLDHMGLLRETIGEWELKKQPAINTQRVRLMSEALRPAETTEHWRSLRTGDITDESDDPDERPPLRAYLETTGALKGISDGF